MTIEQFKQLLKERGLEARKRRGKEVFDIYGDAHQYKPVTYADIHPYYDISMLLQEKRIR